MVVKFNKKDQKIQFSRIERDEKLEIQFEGGLKKLKEKAAIKWILEHTKSF